MVLMNFWEGNQMVEKLRPKYKQVFCGEDLVVSKDLNNPDPQDAFKVECVLNEKTAEPKNWSLSISENGNLLMVYLKRK